MPTGPEGLWQLFCLRRAQSAAQLSLSGLGAHKPRPASGFACASPRFRSEGSTGRGPPASSFMQAGHARFVPGTQFQRVDRPITKGEDDRFGLVPPPVICQIPGICVRASVIVPFLPIGGAARKAERSPLVTDSQCRRGVHRRQDNYRVKTFVSGSCRPLMAQAKCIGNAGGRGATSSTVPEPQEKHVYMGRRLATLDEPQQFGDGQWSYPLMSSQLRAAASPTDPARRSLAVAACASEPCP